MIGFDAVIGRYPEDMTLKGDGTARLGQSSVLGGTDPQRPAQVGGRSRIGLTTQLN